MKAQHVHEQVCRSLMYWSILFTYESHEVFHSMQWKKQTDHLMSRDDGVVYGGTCLFTTDALTTPTFNFQPVFVAKRGGNRGRRSRVLVTGGFAQQNGHVKKRLVRTTVLCCSLLSVMASSELVKCDIAMCSDQGRVRGYQLRCHDSKGFINNEIRDGRLRTEWCPSCVLASALCSPVGPLRDGWIDKLQTQ